MSKARAALDAPQLPQTSSRKNGKPSIFQMAQKIDLMIRLFFGMLITYYLFDYNCKKKRIYGLLSSPGSGQWVAVIGSGQWVVVVVVMGSG